MHGLDYFCTLEKITLTELANLLGISKSAPTNWKNGTKNFPDKYKQVLYNLFLIPVEKRYLLELNYITEVDRAEIELIFKQNQVDKVKVEMNDDVEKVEIQQVIIESLEREVSNLKQHIKMLILLKKIKISFNSSVGNEIINNKKLELVEELIEKINEL